MSFMPQLQRSQHFCNVPMVTQLGPIRYVRVPHVGVSTRGKNRWGHLGGWLAHLNGSPLPFHPFPEGCGWGRACEYTCTAGACGAQGRSWHLPVYPRFSGHGAGVNGGEHKTQEIAGEKEEQPDFLEHLLRSRRCYVHARGNVCVRRCCY